MPHTADIIIIGAGIIGLSTALQLAKRSTRKVVVIEQGATVGEGSSGASSAVCRHLYTHREIVELARDGISAYRNWNEFLAQPRKTRAQFQQIGVLWVDGESRAWGEAQHARLNELGIEAQLLSDADLTERFPALNPAPFATDPTSGEIYDQQGANTHLFEPSGGYMDPQYALEDLRDAVIARGVEIHMNKRVSKPTTGNGAITGVITSDGDAYHSNTVVNASGPWCNSLLREVGLADHWPLRPTRIQILYLPRPPELNGPLPVCGDLGGGIYFRPQGQQLIVGSTRAEDEQEEVADPNEFNRLADDEFTALKLHALHHRLPELPYRGKVGGYSGLYTVNSADMHPVLGCTEVEGFVVANGFSGHGFKLAPAIGSLLAQTLTGERIDGDTNVPIDFLGWHRQPIELNAKTVLA